MRYLFGARTWLSLAYVTLGLPFGIVLFTVTVTALAVSFGLIPLFLVGILLLWATVHVVRGLAAVERARARLFFREPLRGRPLPRPEGGVLRRSWALLASRGTWKEIGYCLAMLPVGAFGYAVVVSLWAVALAGLLLPAYGPLLPGDEISTWVHWSEWSELAVGFGIGLVALLLAPVVTRAYAEAELGMVRALLCASDNEVLRARVSTLQESRARVVDAADAERRRIERDLHDGAQQHLVSLAMNLGRAKEKLDSDPEAARDLVAAAHQQAKESIVELRNVIRGVHPAVLTERGLDAALSALVARSPVPVRLDVDLTDRPDPTAEAVAYFVVSEALTNVSRHAGATQVLVHVERDGDRLLLSVTDDGRGGAAAAPGSGLAGLRDRVSAVDGRFWLHSPPGGGTTLAVEVPCAS